MELQDLVFGSRQTVVIACVLLMSRCIIYWLPYISHYMYFNLTLEINNQYARKR